ncbi:MAG: hypothetical protein KatS3mg110_0675 [Pirellulaceae bacterium]|nr:MAG: hypothetical protein KatS3mg110_0675 [Pirellulaceae bacterium]
MVGSQCESAGRITECWAIRLARAVRWMASCLLVIASLGKLREVLFIDGFSLTPRDCFLLVIACGELAVGLWLLSAWCSDWALHVATCFFAVFTGFSAVAVANRWAECGCFGRLIDVAPAYVLVLDVVILAALFWVVQRTSGRRSPSLAKRFSNTCHGAITADWFGQSHGMATDCVSDKQAAVVNSVDGSARPHGACEGEGIPLPDRGLVWYERAALLFVISSLAGVVAWGLSPERQLARSGFGKVGALVRGRHAWITHPVMLDVGGEGVVWKTEMRVVNPWQVPIKLTEVRSSCNCAVPELPSEILPAHGEVTIPIRVTVPQDGQARPVYIDMKAESGHTLSHILSIVRYPSVVIQPWSDTSAGHRDDTLTPQDGHAGEQSVADIPRIVSPGNDTLSFGEVAYGRSFQKEWFIQFLYDRQFGDGMVGVELGFSQPGQVEGVLSPLERLEPVYEGRIGRCRVCLTLRLSERAAQQAGATTVLLWVTPPGKVRHAVPLTAVWRTRQVLEVDPPQVLLELDPRHRSESELVLRVRHSQGRAFRITRVISASPWLNVSVDESLLSDQHQITATVDPTEINDWATTTLVCETDLGEQPNITVRVSVRKLESFEHSNGLVEGEQKKKSPWLSVQWGVATRAIVAITAATCLLWLMGAIAFPSDGPYCRVLYFPNIDCAEMVLGQYECSGLQGCRPHYVVCTPAPTICSIDGREYPFSETLGRWELGACTPYPYRTCVQCTNGCAYICERERLGTHQDFLSGHCIGEICLQVFWGAPGQCSR